MLLGLMLVLAQVAGSADPCAVIAGSETLVHAGIAAPVAADGAPRPLRRGLRLIDDDQPLLADRYRIDDPALAAFDGRPATLFRPLRIDGEERLCTSEQRTDLFGPDQGNFLLRCLDRADAQGLHHASTSAAALVPYDGRGRAAITGDVAAPALAPLTRAIRLTPDDGGTDRSTLPAHLLTRLTVRSVSGTSATLRLEQVATIEPGRTIRSWREPRDIVVALADGATAAIDGNDVRVAQAGRGWTIALTRRAPDPELVCDGAAVAIGDSLTIFTPGGMSVLSRDGAAAR